MRPAYSPAVLGEILHARATSRRDAEHCKFNRTISLNFLMDSFSADISNLLVGRSEVRSLPSAVHFLLAYPVADRPHRNR
jgi:hypothetical protein